MTVYVVQRVAKETSGEFAAGTVEKVFKDKAKAEAFMQNKPAVWEEVVHSSPCYCERGLFICEVEE